MLTKHDPILAGLNADQCRAVTAPDGPVLILAGAGSGKTRALTHRIAYLIRRGVPANQILAVTFTNKAAREVAERVAKLSGLRPGHKGLLHPASGTGGRMQPFIGTFHRLANHIIQSRPEQVGLRRPYTIYDENDQLAAVKDAIKELELDPKQFAPAAVLAAISRAKQELTNADQYLADARGLWPETVGRVWQRYDAILRKANAVDFDDLLSQAVTILQDPLVRSEWQKRFQHVLVDEYQDTNHAQYVLVKLLAEKTRRLFAIGDDAQSIYSFRGADFRNILNFEHDWPDATVIVLNENYRSTKTILAAASHLIGHNTLQKPKELVTQNATGPKITVTLVSDEQEEAEALVAEATRLQKEAGLKLSQMAVLYRTNAQSRAIEQACLERGIPYALLGGVAFYQRREVKDVLAYLRLLVNPTDQIAFRRIANVPARGLGKVGLAKAEIAWMQHGLSPNHETAQIGESGAALFALLRNLRERTNRTKAAPLIADLLTKISYEAYLKANFPDADERWENVGELITVASQYDRLPPPEGITALLEEASLVDDSNELMRPADRLHLLTLHAAKGLEFDAVFIAGLEEGVFPHSRSLLDPAELEEERRLAYVGLTRAKQYLTLLVARTRTLFGSTRVNPPSRFLNEIPPELLEVSEPPARGEKTVDLDRIFGI
ncbi:UvrD-helicase domain-containing protein [Candidatus Parcubacteria bacterium]|nr:UvrD-helicase domain-containing protein [Candidatus Parcubacteria bacterium]